MYTEENRTLLCDCSFNIVCLSLKIHLSVDKIRDWIGDFSKERCLAKYVARLGQAFTTTESSLIQDAEENLIDDIVTEDGKYTFSDGIGRISKPIAVKVSSQ